MNIPANDENLIGILEKLGKKKFLAHLLFEQITKVMAVYLPFTQRNWVASVFENVVRLDGND